MSTFPSPAQTRIPLSLLTGFLGSGKTTLLNRLVRDPAFARTLVIINEFGMIGIDHDLVSASQEREVLVEMSSGCLCCTIRSDLIRTLRDAPFRFAREGVCWFDRVLIETTGLADPIPLLHTALMDERIAQLYRLDSVITTVDAATALATLDAQDQSVRQIAVADRLVLTKTDLVESAAINAVTARVRTINPAAPLILAVDGAIEPSSLFDAGLYDPATKGEQVLSWLNAEAYADPNHHDHAHHDHGHDVNRHDAHIDSICLTFDQPLHGEAFERWIEVLTMFAGPQILRVKGLLNLAEFDRPAVIHGVQHVFHPPVLLDAWPSDDRRSRVVFITCDIDEAAVRQTIGIMTAGISRFEVYGPQGSDFAGASLGTLPVMPVDADYSLTLR